MASNRRSAEQHPEAHVISPRQGQLDGDLPPGHRDIGLDDRTGLRFAVAGPDLPFVHQGRLRQDRDGLVTLERVDHETNPPGEAARDLLDIPGVQRGGSGAGVDLGLHGIHPEVGEGDPLPPPDLRQNPHRYFH